MRNYIKSNSDYRQAGYFSPLNCDNSHQQGNIKMAKCTAEQRELFIAHHIDFDKVELLEWLIEWYPQRRFNNYCKNIAEEETE